MTGYMDIGRFGYNADQFGGMGIAPTPLMMGDSPSMGASNPVNSYLQTNTPSSTGTGGIGGISNYGKMGGGFDTSPMVPKPGGVGGNKSGSGSGLGFNMDTAKLALGGIQTIGSLWQAWEANKLAKEQFKFQKDFANTNLANQIQSYNTTLEDRSRSRANTEGQSTEDAQAYIDKNSLRRST